MALTASLLLTINRDFVCLHFATDAYTKQGLKCGLLKNFILLPFTHQKTVKGLTFCLCSIFFFFKFRSVHVDMCSDELFELSPLNITRSHKYKLYKNSSRINARC